MSPIILFASDFTQSIINNPSKLKDRAIEQIHTTAFWLELATAAHTRFLKYGNQLSKNSRLFSDQFFDGYDSIYACYCLHQYLASLDDVSRNFRNTVMLLFF